jgi:hypothetical protein
MTIELLRETGQPKVVKGRVSRLDETSRSYPPQDEDPGGTCPRVFVASIRAA